MSMNNNLPNQDDSDITISNDTTVVSSPSTSKTTITPSHPAEYRQTYLDVPPFRPSRPSRPSLDSTYSELSELSFLPSELQTHHPLIRSISHQDATPKTPPRSRIGAALHSFYVTNYGAMLVLASQFFGAGMNVSTRLLETPGPHGEAMHPFQILFARQSITSILCTSYGIYSKAVPHFPFGPREVRWLLVVRGLSGFFGVFGLYFSLLYLPLSEATVLTFLSPILTCYLCSFIIPGQTFTKQQQLAGLLSLIGVLFIAQPATLFSSSSPPETVPPQSPTNSTISSPSNSTLDHPIGPQKPTSEQHLQAIGVAMLGVLGAVGALTSIRTIGKRAHAFISINYFSVWCTFVTLVALIVFPDVKFRFPGNLTEWGLLLSLGFCGFVMQFLLTAGLAYGGPGTENLGRHGSAGSGVGPKIRDVESTDTTIPTPTSAVATPERRLSIDLDTDSTAQHPPMSSSSGTRATSMVYTQMLFALAGDKFVFGVSPGTMSWIGSVLILAGAVWVASARDKDEKMQNGRGSGTGQTDENGRRRRPNPGKRRLMPGKDGNSTMVEEAEEADESLGLMSDIGDRNFIPGTGNEARRDEDEYDAQGTESVEMQDLSTTADAQRQG